jgi:hypothetical protein
VERTVADQILYLQQVKAQLATNLQAMGVALTGSESFMELVNLVLTIGGGT